jgi:metal-responsive CopG/Arc/MetJ family transcriptional regulator
MLLSILMNGTRKAIRKRINITLHPIELKKLDKMANANEETRSGMFSRLIMEYGKETRQRKKDVEDLTELSYDLRDRD